MSKMYEALLRAEQERRRQESREPQPRPEPQPESRLAPQTENARPVPVSRLTPLPVADSFTAVPSIAAPSIAEPSLADHQAPAAAVPAESLPFVESIWRPNEKSLLATQARGQIVEQIRVLRSRIHEIRASEPPLQVLMIGSALPEEGKSFVTANLAVSLASYKSRRVLLIDGDMRRGTMHLLLGTNNKPGLTDYLMNRATIGEIMQRRRRVVGGSPEEESPNDGLQALSFIPCGDDADNAADLSGNGRFEQLLNEVRPFFDWIIVDSSPVNLVADGVNMARVCDGVVLVTRGGVTRYENAQRALHELKAARVIGAVMNASHDVPPNTGYYGYDGYDKKS